MLAHAGAVLAPVALVLAVIITDSAVSGCAQDRPASSAAATEQQQCVQAVFDVLSGMVTKPYDDQVFQDFVTRYGTTSAQYTAYRDSFSSFTSISRSEGVRAAENRLRAEVASDCATPS